MTKGTYTEGIGRRKTAVARVRLVAAKKTSMMVNDREISDYFPNKFQQDVAVQALEGQNYDVSVHVNGGGLSAQADAIRLGAARALIKIDASLRGDLKKKGFLMRDSRAVERKKFGKKKARRSPQWSKR
jgi:small subunit ribosomal protein S9